MNHKNYIQTEYNQPFIRQRADPFVCKNSEGGFYFTASVPEYDRIILRSADTLEGLSKAKERCIWKKHKTGPQSIHIWAPEIHYLFGGWYIYYAAGETDDIWKIRPYVLRCQGNNPMSDDWEEMGLMEADLEDEFSFRSFSLDATVFGHRGSNYVVWAEKTGVGKKQISNLYISLLKSPVQLAYPQVLLSTPDYAWERKGFWVNEGAAVIKNAGKIFLTYSASETGSDYCMGMLYADENADLLDPAAWRKLNRPVLMTDSAKGLFGPGHNSFVKNAAEGHDVCVYHARQYDQIIGNPLYDPNRHTFIMNMQYDKNGFPVFKFENNARS